MTTDITTAQPDESFQQFVDRFPNPVRALRSLPSGKPWLETRLVSEYSNWMLEQEASRKTTVLFHQSEHMSDVFVTGPDALRVFSDLAINPFGTFKPGTAKQFIAATEEGYLVGDGILIYLEENSFDLIADASVAYWVQYHVEQGDYDVELTIDHPNHWFIPLRSKETDPILYRYEIQGPDALKVVEIVTGAPVPEVKFFHLTEFTIAGHKVNALRHGMAGQPGFEFFGPYSEGEAVRDALLEAGKAFDIEPVGYTAYFTNNLESGWFVVSVPGFVFGEGSQAFREWAPSHAVGPFAGSFDSENIEDYLVTPYDVGYGPFIATDRDFIGRESLTALAEKPAKQKVTLIWDAEDFGNLYTGLLSPENEDGAPLYRSLQDIAFTIVQFDRVLAEGKTVGYTIQSGFVAFDQRFISLAAIDAEFAEPGTEVTIIWGDSTELRRSEFPPHRQVSVRATVAPTPFSDYARDQYRK